MRLLTIAIALAGSAPAHAFTLSCADEGGMWLKRYADHADMLRNFHATDAKVTVNVDLAAGTLAFGEVPAHIDSANDAKISATATTPDRATLDLDRVSGSLALRQEDAGPFPHVDRWRLYQCEPVQPKF